MTLGPSPRHSTTLSLPLALAVSVLAAGVQGQMDWDKAVKKANEHRRYAVRRAAGHKVARAGDEAVAAIRRYEAAKGRENIVLTLIDSIAKAETKGPLTRDLLEEWAQDREFYWRSQAFAGLANRAIPEYRKSYLSALADPSHLYRIAAARGLLRLPTAETDMPRVLPLLKDPDPRVRLRVGIDLLQHDDLRGLPAIVSTLETDEQVFLDDPWGKRNATQAIRALEKFAKIDFGYRSAEDEKSRMTALAKVKDYARKKTPKNAPQYTRPEFKSETTVGGFDIRSCRHGDLFVQWTANGLVSFGLEQGDQVQITTDAWAKITPRSAAFQGTKIHGRVVCDYLRLRIEDSEVHQKCAPAALPSPMAAWLRSLANAIEAAGREDLAKRITQRLTQFIPDEKK